MSSSRFVMAEDEEDDDDDDDDFNPFSFFSCSLTLGHFPFSFDVPL